MSDAPYLLPLATCAVAVLSSMAGGFVSALVYWTKFLSPKFASAIDAHVARTTEKIRDEFTRGRETRSVRMEAYKDLLRWLFLLVEEAQNVRREMDDCEMRGAPTTSPALPRNRANFVEFTRLAGWAIGVLPSDSANAIRCLCKDLQDADEQLAMSEADGGPLLITRQDYVLLSHPDHP